MNKRYIKCSLLIPLIYSLLLYLNMRFGSTGGDFKIRPYGAMSDFISFIIFIVITTLGISNLSFYFKGASKKSINTLMLIFNTVYFIFCCTSISSILLGGSVLVLLIISGLIIPYIIVYIIQIFRLIMISSGDLNE